MESSTTESARIAELQAEIQRLKLQVNSRGLSRKTSMQFEYKHKLWYEGKNADAIIKSATGGQFPVHKFALCQTGFPGRSTFVVAKNIEADEASAIADCRLPEAELDLSDQEISILLDYVYSECYESTVEAHRQRLQPVEFHPVAWAVGHKTGLRDLRARAAVAFANDIKPYTTVGRNKWIVDDGGFLKEDGGEELPVSLRGMNKRIFALPMLSKWDYDEVFGSDEMAPNDNLKPVYVDHCLQLYEQLLGQSPSKEILQEGDGALLSAAMLSAMFAVGESLRPKLYHHCPEHAKAKGYHEKAIVRPGCSECVKRDAGKGYGLRDHRW